MKPLILLAVLLVGLVCGLRSVQPARVDGHVDGEIRPTLSLRIIDADTSERLAGVEVRYFSKLELDLIEEIQIERARLGRSMYEAPEGTLAVSDAEGISRITCVFDTAFLWSFESGERRDVGIDVFPRGRFVVTKSGYESHEWDASVLLPEKHYTPELLRVVVTIKLKKAPNNRYRE